MTLTKREKILIVVGLIVVILAMYFVYFWIPYTKNKTDANAKLTANITELNSLNLKSASTAKLEKQIEQLKNQIKTDWSSVPTDIDDARILLYLKKLTNSRAVSVNISVTDDVKAEGPFLLQTFKVDFSTTYSNLLAILGDLKKNELYNRVSYLQTNYQPSSLAETDQPQATSAHPAPAATANPNVITVHIEFSFIALQPDPGVSPEPAMTPTVTARSNSLMPVK
jgi:hypothetical protein